MITHLLSPGAVEMLVISKFDVDYSYDHSYGYSHRFADIGRNWYFVCVTWMMVVRSKEQCGGSVAFDTGRL